MSDLLSSMDDQIIKAKEQALSRKDILDKVEKCIFAFEEEKWLDEYEKVKRKRKIVQFKIFFYFSMVSEVLVVLFLFKERTCFIV